MPGKHNAGGCACCGGGPVSCDDCAGSPPLEKEVELTGWNGSYCDCSSLNGVYVVTLGGVPGVSDCVWSNVFDTDIVDCGGLGPEVFIAVWIVLDGGHYYLRGYVADKGFGSTPNYGATYELDLGTSEPSCDVGGTLTLKTSTIGICDPTGTAIIVT